MSGKGKSQKRRSSRLVNSTMACASTSWGWVRLRFIVTESQAAPPGCYLEVGFHGRKEVQWFWPLDSGWLYRVFGKEWRKAMAFELKKREENGEAPKFLDDFNEPWFVKEYPAVHEVLFRASFPDGSFRETGMMLVWRSPEGITVKVQDGEVGLAWQYTAESFVKALKKVEGALQAGTAPNRSTKARPSRQKVKRK